MSDSANTVYPIGFGDQDPARYSDRKEKLPSTDPANETFAWHWKDLEVFIPHLPGSPTACLIKDLKLTLECQGNWRIDLKADFSTAKKIKLELIMTEGGHRLQTSELIIENGIAISEPAYCGVDYSLGVSNATMQQLFVTGTGALLG